MKATAIAPANIAFIKYWGKSDEAQRLPVNSSVSMNLSEAYTTTTVEFSKQLSHDDIIFLSDDSSANNKRPHKVNELENSTNRKEVDRVISHLDRIRTRFQVNERAKVMTKNSFPAGAGIASSASGFAALSVASTAALGQKMSEKELSILARLGSGSACRSIPDGFVLWEKGTSSDTSFARSIFPSSHWKILDIIAVVEKAGKKVSSSEGMTGVRTSPFFQARLQTLPPRMATLVEAIKKKDFAIFGSTAEEECLNMHAVMMTQDPPAFYWNDNTVKIMLEIMNWRTQGLSAYFTIDAGPNVHVMCEEKERDIILGKIQQISGVERIIVNCPAIGAHLVDAHLF